MSNDIKSPLIITEEDIDGMINLQYGSSSVLPILQILYPNLDYKNSTFHIDHIYPKTKFSLKNKELDEDYLWKANYLFNLQLLQGEENILKRAKDPEVWMKEEFKTDEKIKNYKRNNYIEEDLSLEWPNIKNPRRRAAGY